VAHPDRPKRNGFMAYTRETRGTLKKLLPTCKPPTAEELAKAEAFKTNPLAGHPYVLLRDSYANALVKGGVSVPAGTSPYKFAGIACGTRTPDCPKINEAIKASAASSVRADANGAGTFPGVRPGTYYLMTRRWSGVKPCS
jgi:hypothetical protein